MTTVTVKRVLPPFILSHEVARAGLRVLQAFTGYALMLAVMYVSFGLSDTPPAHGATPFLQSGHSTPPTSFRYLWAPSQGSSCSGGSHCWANTDTRFTLTGHTYATSIPFGHCTSIFVSSKLYHDRARFYDENRIDLVTIHMSPTAPKAVATSAMLSLMRKALLGTRKKKVGQFPPAPVVWSRAIVSALKEKVFSTGFSPARTIKVAL